MKGDRLWLGVGDLPLNDQDCQVHAYREQGKTTGAYRANCRSWATDGYDVLVFFAALRNDTRQALNFTLRDFVLTARDGRTFGPVNVRSQADVPPNFLPEKGKILPGQAISGYLTFDGRAVGVVAARISYVNGRQTLGVVFAGKHTVV